MQVIQYRSSFISNLLVSLFRLSRQNEIPSNCQVHRRQKVQLVAYRILALKDSPCSHPFLIGHSLYLNMDRQGTGIQSLHREAGCRAGTSSTNSKDALALDLGGKMKGGGKSETVTQVLYLGSLINSVSINPKGRQRLKT